MIHSGVIKDTLEKTEAVDNHVRTVTMRAESLAITEADFFKTLLDLHEERRKHLNELSPKLARPAPDSLSEGVPRTRKAKSLCVRLWKWTCFDRRVLLSSFFFLLLSFFFLLSSSFLLLPFSFSSFFSHPESCLKIGSVVGKSDVLGTGVPGGGKNEKKT